ncbi:capsular polysaccharide transport system permease protein [Methylobacillus rhizosphaerae]|uniref:Capsular polysaccharide transport system permease protein n=1 Tax=Methylobacillus rhizosphaerae TaxID=551994 RepID=A0A238XLZ0_9PROT|nr:chain-length determining protein [Methylobacillus rhizosphaerae]SNR59720.1 capsular polysaccharide transport system permease protein [Methylobacillus rhizosphaerae]
MTATHTLHEDNQLPRHLQKSRESLAALMFKWLIRLVLILSVLVSLYWIFFASERYVSEANLVLRKTDSISAAGTDLVSALLPGSSTPTRPDQLLLREYLLSVDMLKMLDAKLDLRTHYSNKEHDIISRMWFQDASMEWFYLHYLSRVSVEFDDYAGVLRINVQAYDPKMAQAIANMLVHEGERYMNQLGHELASVQVNFFTQQVTQAQERYQTASRTLLNYQNKKGILSPQAVAESINTIITGLETQRTQLQTKLASLPTSLNENHPNILMLKQSLAAVDKQIAEEKAKLATPSGKTLSSSVEEFQRLQMQVTFAQELYSSSLIALEKGRLDAARMLDKVSILQAPTLAEFPMQPRRIYNVIVTLLIGLMLAGILKLLEAIILDHVD